MESVHLTQDATFLVNILDMKITLNFVYKTVNQHLPFLEYLWTAKKLNQLIIVYRCKISNVPMVVEITMTVVQQLKALVEVGVLALRVDEHAYDDVDADASLFSGTRVLVQLQLQQRLTAYLVMLETDYPILAVTYLLDL